MIRQVKENKKRAKSGDFEFQLQNTLSKKKRSPRQIEVLNDDDIPEAFSYTVAQLAWQKDIDLTKGHTFIEDPAKIDEISPRIDLPLNSCPLPKGSPVVSNGKVKQKETSGSSDTAMSPGARMSLMYNRVCPMEPSVPVLESPELFGVHHADDRGVGAVVDEWSPIVEPQGFKPDLYSHSLGKPLSQQKHSDRNRPHSIDSKDAGRDSKDDIQFMDHSVELKDDGQPSVDSKVEDKPPIDSVDVGRQSPLKSVSSTGSSVSWMEDTTVVVQKEGRKKHKKHRRSSRLSGTPSQSSMTSLLGGIDEKDSIV